VIGLINFVFGFLFSATWRDPPDRTQSPAKPATASDATEPLNVRKFLPISCGTAIYLIGQMALITYVPLYLKDVMGFSAYWASQALALTQAGAMIGRIGWGVVSDRVFGGQRKNVLLVIGGLSAGLVGALSVMTAESPLYLVLTILFLSGICLVGYQGVSYALIGELAGKAKTGTALGMMITINAACATLGTPLFGYIVDRSGSYAIAWRVLAAALTAGILGLATLLEEPQRSEQRRTLAQPSPGG
jgi:predicted MFS family arabinose efflux permease